MNILRIFGFGAERILAGNCCIPGTVTDVRQCWWFTVNTKPVRRFSGDGAVYPNIITFSYRVDNIPYTGKRYVPIRYRVPQKGETITVFYDPKNPKRYACCAFGQAK